MTALVRQLPEAEVRAIVDLPDIDVLLNLDPPLGTILSPHERSDVESIRRSVEAVGIERTANPVEALLNMGWLLKQIRDKREHGFKTRFGPRDAEILRAARNVLEALCQRSLASATPKDR